MRWNKRKAGYWVKLVFGKILIRFHWEKNKKNWSQMTF